MGGGELCSKRTLTYLEGTGLVEGVLDPYLGGGQGSRNALKFLAAVLGLDWSVVDERARDPCVLTAGTRSTGSSAKCSSPNSECTSRSRAT